MMKKSTKPQGFISIIALGIFAMLMIVAINLRMITEEAISNIKNNLNQDQAETIATSMIEYLQRKMNNHDNGWTTGKVICGFGKYKKDETEGGGDSSFCQYHGITFLVTPDEGKAQKDIKIEMEVKGRSADNEKLNSGKCGKNLTNGCYVTPIPGTGDVGDETYCKMYKPSFIGDTGIGAGTNVPADLANGSNLLDQVNYSCNWNKLSFGSSQTDRVAVPLYYEKAKLGENSEIINPFLASNTSDKATKLIVKLRTPCKPCAEGKWDESTMADYLRNCDAETNEVKDETVCADGDRYKLDAKTSDDIIVQWLINGECKNDSGKLEACGIMPIPGDKSSAFYESAILGNNSSKSTAKSSFEVIIDTTKAHDSNNFPDKIYLIDNGGTETPVKLPNISKPLLTLFLSKPLLTEGKHNIPYLEYQVLTDQPVGNSKSTLEASIVVEGNAYKKTLTKQIKVPLIDFAIHN